MATQTKAQIAAAKKKAEAAKKKAGEAAPPAGGTTATAGAATGPTFDVTALTALVEATNDEARQFMYMDPAVAAPLVALGYCETRDDMKGPTAEGTEGIAARSTDAGAAALAAAPVVAAAPPAAPASPFGAKVAAPAASPAAAPAAPAAAATASAFKIVANVPIPAAKRFGKSSTYPFDALEVGQGFFVPATEARPNPAKSMASTVNSAKARYAVLDGKDAAGEDKFKNTRDFVLRNVQDGEGFGPEFKGVKGAGIWRTA